MTADYFAQLATATVGLLHGLMACAAWLLLRAPRHADAVRLWALGTLAAGLALAPAGFTHFLPDAVRDGLMPLLLLAAGTLRLLALRRHSGQPLRVGAVLAMAVLVAIGWCLCLLSPDLRVRASYGNAVLVVGTALVGWHAWEAGRNHTAPKARWVAGTEWALTAALVLRAAAIPLTAPDAGPLPASWHWLLAMGAATLSALVGNLGFLGMVLDDQHRAALQARQAQLDETASREAAEQTAHELQTLLAQRDALAGERESLLQMLAHEIRQPLHSAGLAMQAAVQVLVDPGSSRSAGVDTQLLGIQTVLGDVRSVLDNTLAAATLLARETPLVRQDVALDFLVELTLGDLGGQQLTRLTVDWRTELAQLEVEPGLVRLALRNLLHNAFAHGGPGVEVQLRIEEEPATNTLRLTVADDGPGMAPQRLRDAHTGSGGLPSRRRLGLAVVRQVMDLHGGQLLLSNALPRGFVAQLVFALPADEWEMDDALAEALVGGDPAVSDRHERSAEYVAHP